MSRRVCLAYIVCLSTLEYQSAWQYHDATMPLTLQTFPIDASLLRNIPLRFQESSSGTLKPGIWDKSL